jgi:hypothetical protein
MAERESAISIESMRFFNVSDALPSTQPTTSNTQLLASVNVCLSGHSRRGRQGYAAATPALCSSLIPASRLSSHANNASQLLRLNTFTS